MKILDTAITEIVKGNSTRYYSKYIVDKKEYTNTLNKFNFQNITNPNNEITIGNTCASSVTFSIYMPQVSLENKEITIYEGVKVSNEIKYIKLGTFTVSKQTSNGEYTSYEAYDKMYKADMPYSSDLVFPSTDKAILTEICGKLGISLATDIVTVHTVSDKPQGYTMREIIGYMAMLQGCNAVINADGNLELRWYKDSGYVLDGHKYYQQGVTFTTSKDFIIQKLTCNNTKSGDKETSTITSGSGATGLSFANPFMTQAVLDEVYKKIGGFTFRPLAVKFIGDFRLEAGDIITVSTKDGKEYKVPIMQIAHECDGGLISTATSIGQSESSNNTASSGPITKAMQRYYAELVTINKALINKLDVETAKITYATITNFNAVKGDVDYLKVNNLTVDKANLLYASIKRMEVVEGQIRNLNVDDLKAQVANINTLMFGSASGGSLTTEFSNSIVANIGDAQIKSAMIESIAADKITSGKIYTNLVEILSESGNLDIADNTIQIKDDNKVTRVQIGKDATNDYNIYVWDKSGNLMFDALGLTEKGVKREIIRNDMIKEDANINASKLDIESLFNVINEDGSHTLKSSKIYVDANKQTLDVAFKNMTTNVTNLQNTVTTQGTQLTAVQGQISSKVWKQDITTAVNDIQIGGTNLIRNSNFFQKDAYWAYDTGTGTIISDNSVIGNVLVFKPTGGYLRVLANTWNVWVANEIYTVSFYAKASVANTTITPSRSMADSASAVTLTTTWKRYTGTIRSTATSDSGTLSFSVNNINATYYIAAVKLEKGNKATDWSPAPEDVDSSISAVDNKVTTISNQYTSLNQTVNSISGTVNSHTEQIKQKADNSTVTTINNKVTSLTTDLSGFKTTVSNTYATKNSLSNYATTTAMNSAISQSANSITQSVSATYATKSSLSSYATTASLSAYIAKTDTGTLKSCIEAIADTINITARGGLNLSGNRFTLSSTNTTITMDGTITTKKFVGNGGTIGGWNIDSTSIYSDYLYNATVGYGKYRVSLNKSTGSDSKIFSVRETVKDNVFNYPFYVRSDGYMYSVKGQISGFQFDSNKMSNTVSIYLLPDKDVLHTLRNAIVNNTTSQLALSQYDLNGSGKVDLTDFVVAKNYVLGTQTETDFSKWKYAKKSDITYKLNPSDVKNASSISGTDIWGKTRRTTLGIGTLYSNEISCDNLIVKDPVDYSTFNTFLNTINVKETSTSIDLENFVRNYTIKGNGMLVVNISIWTDTKDDYGTTTAKIYIDGNCVMNNRNRLANSHPSELAGGATFVWWFNDNATHRIKLEAGSTKEGTKTYTQSIQALFGLQIST
jgi:hypothetical protein